MRCLALSDPWTSCCHWGCVESSSCRHSPGVEYSAHATVMRADPTALEAACARWIERPTLQFASALVVGQLAALGSATQLYVNWSMTGLDASFGGLLTLKSVEFALWAACVPLVVRIDRRLDGGTGWVGSLVGHLAAATLAFLLLNVPAAGLMKLGQSVAPDSTFWSQYLFRLSYRLPSGWVTYAAILTVARLLREFVRSQRLSRDLDRAQLRVLRAQVQPHFLFNTLHTAASLVRSGDRGGAVETMADLGDLLRRSLKHGSSDTVPLQQELDFLVRYLDIQRRRFGDRLSVGIDVPEELRTAHVPTFLLQPLVENALQHGLELDEGHGDVRVRVDRDGGRLRIRVDDSGGRLHSLPDDGHGVGISNTQRRLQVLYDNRGELDAAVVDGRSVVTVRIPLASEGM